MFNFVCVELGIYFLHVVYLSLVSCVVVDSHHGYLKLSAPGVVCNDMHRIRMKPSSYAMLGPAYHCYRTRSPMTDGNPNDIFAPTNLGILQNYCDVAYRFWSLGELRRS